MSALSGFLLALPTIRLRRLRGPEELRLRLGELLSAVPGSGVNS